MGKILSVILILLSLSGICFAATDSGSLSVSHNYVTTGKYFSVLVENSHPLSLQQARQAFSQYQFSHSTQSVLNFGIGARPHWLTVQIDNETGRTQRRRLVIKNAWLDQLDIYVTDSNGTTIHRQLGDHFPFTARGTNSRFFVFDYDYPHGKSRLFIRVETPDPMIVPIAFETVEKSYYKSTVNAYSYGLLYGILLALLLYNTILYVRIRQPRYLFYVVYLLSFIAMNFSYTGHADQWLWPDDIVLEQWANPLFINTYVFAGIIFAFSFLNVRVLFPRTFMSVYAAGILIAFAQVLLFKQNMQAASVLLAIIQALVFPIGVMILAFFSLGKHREAIYFIVATFTGLVGTALTSITVLGLIPYYGLAYRGVEIGMAVDAILLSFALAEQFRIALEEKKSAQLMARVDALTGLYNRRAFYEMVNPIWHNAIRYHKPLSVMMMDIDHFKSINDNYGHSVGDTVIEAIADILKQEVRKGDVLARWGGEEFIMVLPVTNMKHAMQLAERLLTVIRQFELNHEQDKIHVTLSLGVVERKPDTTSLDDLIKKADHRLYQAKQNGRDRVCAESLD